MKVGILAGGVGSRLSEETALRPKPMVEIGGRPIIWHIMRYYASFGFDEFAIALGYKGEYIKRWFFDEAHLTGDLTIRTGNGANVVEQHRPAHDDWSVQLLETGRETNTGGRIKRLVPHLGPGTFMLTWGGWPVDRRSQRSPRLPPLARQDRNPDSGSTACPVRSHRNQRRPDL